MYIQPDVPALVLLHHIIGKYPRKQRGPVITLDDLLYPDVQHVSAEVIFGESGKDVQTEGFKTRLREVKSSSSKGLDSFSIVAKHITPKAISGLLLPLRSIMAETETTKTMGLEAPTQNPKKKGKKGKEDKIKAADVVVQTKRQVQVDTDHYANNSYRSLFSVLTSKR
ncbi:hypothetical protein MPER_01293, partial [Moniliophthora perniciosa FA553]